MVLNQLMTILCRFVDFHVSYSDYLKWCFTLQQLSSHSTEFCCLHALQEACKELVQVNILCKAVFAFHYPACPPILAWKNNENELRLVFCLLFDAFIHAASLIYSLRPCRSSLCPLTSINVMVLQWWRTLSLGCTPLLIWLLLMGENMINKLNYPWPISNGWDTGLIFMSSLKYEYEEI